MFKIDSQKVKLSHLNVRKEATGEEKGATLAADVKFKCLGIPASVLKMIAPVDRGTALNIVDALFTENGSPRFHDGWGSIHFDAKFGDADVKISGKLFKKCKLVGFKVTRILDGKKVDLTFTAQVYPSEEYLGFLGAKIEEEVTISVEGEPELDLEGEKGEGTKKDSSQPELSVVK